MSWLMPIHETSCNIRGAPTVKVKTTIYHGIIRHFRNPSTLSHLCSRALTYIGYRSYYALIFKQNPNSSEVMKITFEVTIDV